MKATIDHNPEISETIARQKQEADGELRYQLCALIFLIGQLPHNNELLDAGIRANAETLADLLVTDLTTTSTELRKKVPELLEKLVASGAAMQVDDEYRMQTREGSEWVAAFGCFGVRRLVAAFRSRANGAFRSAGDARQKS